MIFLEGIGTGLLLAFVFGLGPAFFMLIQTSITHGFKSAIQLAIGISLCDMMIVTLCLMSSIQFNFSDPKNELWAGLAAGIVLILFGIYTYFHKNNNLIKKVKNTESELNEKIVISTKKPLWVVLLAKGFVMNIFNPFVWIYWLTLVATISGRMDGNKYDEFIFFAGVFCTVFSIDILKSFGASALKRFFTPKMLCTMNKITGGLLVCFGIYIILRVLIF